MVETMLKALSRRDVENVIAVVERRRKAKGLQPFDLGDVEKLLNDPQVQEFYDTLRALSRDARMELAALMLVGRGDFDGDFARALSFAERKTDDDLVSYIGGKTARLAQYLRKGLEEIARP
jgi:hypothetical protein